MSTLNHLKSKFSIASYELIKTCSPQELRFYLWLKLWAINKSSAFPSYKTIATDLGMSRRSVIRLIREMEQKGRLGVKRQNGRNNLYDITWYDRIAHAGHFGKSSTTGAISGTLTGDRNNTTTRDRNDTTGGDRSKLEQIESKTNRNITNGDREKITKQLATIRAELTEKLGWKPKGA